MREPVTFETRLSAAFERYADGAPVDVEPIEVARRRCTAMPAALCGPLARSPHTGLALRRGARTAAAGARRSGTHRERTDPRRRHPDTPRRVPRTGPLTADGTRQAILLEDGRVLLVGSGTVQNTGAEFGVAELFDLATDQVTRLADDPTIRTWTPRGTVRLADGRVLRTGGMQTTDPEGGQRPHRRRSSILLQSLSSRSASWSTRVLSTPHAPQGDRVLIAGGEDSIGESDGPTASAELFDPATGSFRAIDPLQRARTDHQATLLDDGRVLLTGGYGPGSVKTAEVFDPASETFEVVGEIRHARIDHSSTLLADGRVLLVGGTAR